MCCYTVMVLHIIQMHEADNIHIVGFMHFIDRCQNVGVGIIPLLKRKYLVSGEGIRDSPYRNHKCSDLQLQFQQSQL